MNYGANDVGESAHMCMLCGKPLLMSKSVYINVGSGLKLLYHPACAEILSDTIVEHTTKKALKELEDLQINKIADGLGREVARLKNSRGN